MIENSVLKIGFWHIFDWNILTYKPLVSLIVFIYLLRFEHLFGSVEVSQIYPFIAFWTNILMVVHFVEYVNTIKLICSFWV